jgi:hypothetical protein
LNNSIKLKWLRRNREIEWELTLGISSRRTPDICGKFLTSLSYLDDQGEKWGDTYIKIVGQHFDDYSHWDSINTLLPISGNLHSQIVFPTFVSTPFSFRTSKGASSGVTGLIGEVLVTVFLQTVLKLGPFDIAHLEADSKAPDLCLNIPSKVIADLFRNYTKSEKAADNNNFADIIELSTWNNPIPLECKSRLRNGDRKVRKALEQIIAYWKSVPDMAGYGIFAQIDVVPTSKIRLHLIIPKDGESINVRNIICNSKSSFPKNPTYKEFNTQIGGKLLGSK